MRYVTFLLVVYCLMFSSMASANDCPETNSGTLSVQGEYLGWFESERGHHQVCISTSSGREFCVVATEEDAESVFGVDKGVMVQMDYRNEQFKSDNQCVALALLTGGKVLSSTPKAQAKNGSTATSSGETFFLCTNQATSPEQRCQRGGDYTVDPNTYVTFTPGNRAAVMTTLHKGKVVTENFTYDKTKNGMYMVRSANGATEFEMVTKNGRTYFMSGMYTFMKLDKSVFNQSKKNTASSGNPIGDYINKNKEMVFSPCDGKGKKVAQICSSMDTNYVYTFEKGGAGYLTYGARMEAFRWKASGDRITTVNENDVTDAFTLIEGKYFVDEDMALYVIRN